MSFHYLDVTLSAWKIALPLSTFRFWSFLQWMMYLCSGFQATPNDTQVCIIDYFVYYATQIRTTNNLSIDFTNINGVYFK